MNPLACCAVKRGSHHPPSHPFGPLLPRPIALLTEHIRAPAFYSLWSGRSGARDDDPVRQVELDDHEVAPARLDLTPDALPLEVAVPAGGVAVVHVDFGEIVAGTVVLDIDGPSGASVDALFAERLDDDGSLRRDEQHAGFRYVTRGGPDRFETFDTMGFRYAGLSIRAERPVSLTGLSVTERIHPRPEGSFFRCSDPLLDDVWQAGRRTVDLCSFDAYVDCSADAHGSWDYLGGMLVCLEAGASVVDAQGRDLVVLDHGARRTPVAAATPALLDEALAARRTWADRR